MLFFYFGMDEDYQIIDNTEKFGKRLHFLNIVIFTTEEQKQPVQKLQVLVHQKQ